MTHMCRRLFRLRMVSCVLHYSTGKVDVNGVKLFFEKCGHGKRTVLFIPGALGSTLTDFAHQMEGFDKEKFTLISFDPRGYGRSIPPERDFPVDCLNRDADDAAVLMKTLGFQRYFVAGWSDGANAAAILAAKYTDFVEKLVIWGANSYISKEDVEAWETVRDVSMWSPRMKKTMSVMYSEEYVQQTWGRLLDTCAKIVRENDGDLFKSLLKDIKAPTLIIHGMKDIIFPPSHPKFLHENIKGSKLDFWPEGKHNLHIRFPEQFNLQVQNFLLDIP